MLLLASVLCKESENKSGGPLVCAAAQVFCFFFLDPVPASTTPSEFLLFLVNFLLPEFRSLSLMISTYLNDQIITSPQSFKKENLLPLLELLKLSVGKELVHHGGFPCLVRHPVRVEVCSIVHHCANLIESKNLTEHIF